jgi:hypothetical protein
MSTSRRKANNGSWSNEHVVADGHAELDDRISGRCKSNQIWYVDLADRRESARPAHLLHDWWQVVWRRRIVAERVCVQHVEQALSSGGDVHDRRPELQRPEGAELQRAEAAGSSDDEHNGDHGDEERDVIRVAQDEPAHREEHEQPDEEGKRPPHDRVVTKERQARCERGVDERDDEEEE